MSIVFLVRRHNDLDHIVPIVYKFCERGGNSVSVLVINPQLRLSQDFRVRFLQDNYNVDVRNIYRVSQMQDLHWTRRLQFPGRVASDLYRRLVAWINPRIDWPWAVFNESWARSLLLFLKADVLVVDWQKPDRFRTLQILSACRQLGIPVVAVPHAIPLQRNNLITRRQAKRGLPGNYAFNSRFFDLIVSPHLVFAQRLIDAQVPASAIVVLGSARFCEEWRQVLQKIRQIKLSGDAEEARHKRESLRVLFLDQDIELNLQWSLVG